MSWNINTKKRPLGRFFSVYSYARRVSPDILRVNGREAVKSLNHALVFLHEPEAVVRYEVFVVLVRLVYKLNAHNVVAAERLERIRQFSAV